MNRSQQLTDATRGHVPGGGCEQLPREMRDLYRELMVNNILF